MHAQLVRENSKVRRLNLTFKGATGMQKSSSIKIKQTPTLGRYDEPSKYTQFSEKHLLGRNSTYSQMY